MSQWYRASCERNRRDECSKIDRMEYLRYRLEQLLSAMQGEGRATSWWLDSCLVAVSEAVEQVEVIKSTDSECGVSACSLSSFGSVDIDIPTFSVNLSNPNAVLKTLRVKLPLCKVHLIALSYSNVCASSPLTSPPPIEESLVIEGLPPKQEQELREKFFLYRTGKRNEC